MTKMPASGEPVLEPIGVGRSLAEDAADRIRQQVLGGGYGQGHHLVEARIAEELRISRGPVREALKMLRAEGLVTEEPRRGTFVVTVTAQDVRDIYALRAAVEGAAVRALCRAGDEADVARLDAAVDEMRVAGARGDAAAVAAADVAFHALLCRLSGNRRLVETFDRYVPTLRGLLRMDEQVLGSVAAVADQHEPIVEAIRSRDEETAVRLVVEHAEHAGSLLVDLLTTGD